MMIPHPYGFGDVVAQGLNLCVQLQSQNCEFATPRGENCLAANKTQAMLASAATTAGESEQQRTPPAPVPTLSQCTNSPLGCSASDYEALLDDVVGLLYDCAGQGKVNDIH